MMHSGVMGEDLCDWGEGEGSWIDGAGCREYGQTLGIPETGHIFTPR